MKPLIVPLLLGLLLFITSGCQKSRNLKVTEIGTNRVEIFLDEPGDHHLNLNSIDFTWVSQEHAPAGSPTPAPAQGTVSLGLVGSLQGRQFLVIFEDPNYAGPPVAQEFNGKPGIKVRDSFFPGYGNDPGVSMHVNGTHSGTAVLFLPTTETISDVVRFGPAPRPALAGTFNETGALNAIKPRGGQSVSRRFSSGDPVDTNSEADWSLQADSIGVANP